MLKKGGGPALHESWAGDGGWGLGRRKEARAWSAANVSAWVEQDAPRAQSQEGTPSPGPLPGGRSQGWGAGEVAAPASWMAERGLVGCCGLEGREGHFCAASARRWRALRLESGLSSNSASTTARSVTLGKCSNLSLGCFLLCHILLLGEFFFGGGRGAKIGVLSSLGI